MKRGGRPAGHSDPIQHDIHITYTYRACAASKERVVFIIFYMLYEFLLRERRFLELAGACCCWVGGTAEF